MSSAGPGTALRGRREPAEPEGTGRGGVKAGMKAFGACGGERRGSGVRWGPSRCRCRPEPGGSCCPRSGVCVCARASACVRAPGRLSPSSLETGCYCWSVCSQKLRHFQSEERVSLVKYLLSLLQNLHDGKAQGNLGKKQHSQTSQICRVLLLNEEKQTLKKPPNILSHIL